MPVRGPVHDLIDWEEMAIAVGARFHVGRRRAKNEDAYYVDAERRLYIVADGLGGHRSGEVASQLAINEIRRFARAHHRYPASSELLRQAVERANRVVYDCSFAHPSFRGMGTTVVTAMIEDGSLVLAHVGDSRAYLMNEQGLRRLTDDHTAISTLIKRGLISESEAQAHPRRGALHRAVGIDRILKVDTQEVSFRRGIVLLCTDGLTDMLRDGEIEMILDSSSSPQEACDRLVELANERGGKDNVTVVVISRED